MNNKQTIYDGTNHSSTQITWDTLFPKILRSKLKKGFQEKYPNKFQEYFPTGKNIEFTKFLLTMILPSIYRTLPDGSDITDITKGAFSKYWKCSESKNRYNATVDTIVQEARLGNYHFETFEFNHSIYNNLKIILSWLSHDDLESYKEYIENRIAISSEKIFSLKHIQLKERFKHSEMSSFNKRLSCLVALAATWCVWEIPNNSLCNDLAVVILPPLPQDKICNPCTKNWLTEYVQNQKNKSIEKYKEALHFFNQNDYLECYTRCKEIVEGSIYVDDNVVGEAYYKLAIICAEHNYKHNGIVNPSLFLKRAADYGCTEAFTLLNKKNKEHLIFNAKHSTTEFACIVSNTTPENICMNTFLKTMKSGIPNNNAIIYATSASDLLKNLTPQNPLKYLLINDVQEKNFKDFLLLLDTIKFWSNNSISDAIDWSKLTIYLRVNEERYSVLIDTALNHLNEQNIRIHIIDDNKWPAQHLLSRYPLFNCLQSFDYNILHKRNTRKLTINYIVISAKNDDLTNWLIREAFWMSCFYYSNITVSITAVSPESILIDSRLHYDCPSIYSLNIPDEDIVSKIHVNPSIFVKTLESSELLTSLAKINESANSFNYYVLNAGDDITNMNLAIKLREWTIREQINKQNTPDRSTLPFISFYCKDSDIGHLSKKLVVQTLEHGNNWYNNYNIVPFGMLSNKYTLEHISGGYYEQFAQCIHLQYCGVDTSANNETIAKTLRSYFSRCYNRDSSMAVALSIPYRLFQTIVDTETTHIVPSCGWHTIDTNTDDNNSNLSEILSEMATLFKKAIINNIDNESLFSYEHSRWLRFAISRGWISATPEQVIHYMNAGNPKQQLYIARMHGCICSLEDLKKLSKTMLDEATPKNWSRFAEKRNGTYIAKDFIATDKSNILATPDILQTKWFTNNN